jgi:hypothetical protein
VSSDPDERGFDDRFQDIEADVDARFEDVDASFTTIDQNFESLEERLDAAARAAQLLAARLDVPAAALNEPLTRLDSRTGIGNDKLLVLLDEHQRQRTHKSLMVLAVLASAWISALALFASVLALWATAR